MAEFDPNKPFEAVQQFDPNKPFEVVKEPTIKQDDKELSWGEIGKEAVKNIIPSGASAAESMVQPFIHPIDTAKNIGRLGMGVAQKTGVVSGTSYIPYANALEQLIEQRYGSVGNFKRTFAKDPVGVAMDASMFLTGGETALARAPGVVGKIGEVAGAAGRVVDPINVGLKSAKLAKDAAAAGVRKVAPEAARDMFSSAAGAINPIEHFRRVTSPKDAANMDILRAIGRDELTPQTLEARASNVPGRNPTLADVGGENTRGLLERVSQTPGGGRTISVPFLTERQASQRARIGEDLSSLFGTKENSLETIDSKMLARSSSSRPLYEASFSAGDKPIWSKELERLSAAPEFQSAMHGAVTNWQRRQIADGYGAMNPGAMVDAGSGGILKMLHGKVPVFPNLQFWDYTKAALDDMVAAEKLPDGSFTRKGRDLIEITKKLRGELDKAVPSYKKARDAWSGPTSYMNAVRDGQEILKMPADQLVRTFNELTDSDKEAFRIGALSAIKTKMGSDASKMGDMTKYLRSPEMRRKITTLLPDAKSRSWWSKRLDHEVKSSELTGRAIANSATARRLAEAQSAESLVGDLVAEGLSGAHGLTLAHRIAGKTLKPIRDTLMSRRDAEVARVLTDPNEVKNLAAKARQVPPPKGSQPLRSHPRALSLFQVGRLQSPLDQMSEESIDK